MSGGTGKFVAFAVSSGNEATRPTKMLFWFGCAGVCLIAYGTGWLHPERLHLGPGHLFDMHHGWENFREIIEWISYLVVGSGTAITALRGLARKEN